MIVYSSTRLKFVLFANDTNLPDSHENVAKLIENINQEMTKVVYSSTAKAMTMTILKVLNKTNIS